MMQLYFYGTIEEDIAYQIIKLFVCKFGTCLMIYFTLEERYQLSKQNMLQYMMIPRVCVVITTIATNSLFSFAERGYIRMITLL